MKNIALLLLIPGAIASIAFAGSRQDELPQAARNVSSEKGAQFTKPDYEKRNEKNKEISREVEFKREKGRERTREYRK